MDRTPSARGDLVLDLANASVSKATLAVANGMVR
jgi:hypothetical protein